MKKRIIAIFITIVSIFLIGNLLSCGNDNEPNENKGVSASFKYAKVSGTVGYITKSNFDSNSNDENLSKSNLMEEPVFENDESCYMVIDLTITTTADNDGGHNLDILTEISNRAVIRPNIERTPTAKIDQKVSNGAYTLYTTYSVLPKVGDEKKVFMIIELYPVSSGDTDISLLANMGSATQNMYTTTSSASITELYYTINNDGVSYSVTGMNSDSVTSVTSVTVLDTLRDGLPVTGIGDYAFQGCENLINIKLPDGITSIGIDAFSDTVYYKVPYNWENGELYIGDYLIKVNASDIGTYTISEKTKCIAAGAFIDCGKLNEIKLDENNNAFKVVDGGLYTSDGKILILCLQRDSETFTIPDTVNKIYGAAFYNCSKLTKITIPENITSIGSYAFYNCAKLTEIHFDAIAMNDFSYYNYVFSCEVSNREGIKVTIGAEVTKIPAYLFYQSTSVSLYSPNITSVEFEEESKCTSIGDNAFHSCSNLTSITIPNSVTSIGSSAFACTGLGSITLPDSVTNIGDYAFYKCGALNSITIPDSVTNIGNGAFSLCRGLTSVTIPESVTSIGGSAFEDCISLTSITIPDSVESIGDSAFHSCSNLTSITIGSSVTSIGDNAFEYCSGLTSITIGSSVTSIGDNAFEYCSGLTSITIPVSVTSIGNSAFSNCSGLTVITIPENVTSIGKYAFSQCSNLTSITFSDTSTWYTTDNAILSAVTGEKYGEKMNVTDASMNVIYLVTTFDDWYWYKV